jgi:hypothetical protein
MKIIESASGIDMEPENDTDQQILKVLAFTVAQAYQKGYMDALNELEE